MSGRLSKESVTRIFIRPHSSTWLLATVWLCHGLAGLLVFASWNDTPWLLAVMAAILAGGWYSQRRLCGSTRQLSFVPGDAGSLRIWHANEWAAGEVISAFISPVLITLSVQLAAQKKTVTAVYAAGSLPRDSYRQFRAYLLQAAMPVIRTRA